MEYGETEKDAGALKIDDIEYEGVYDIAGVATHYFKYKTSRGHEWATVEPVSDSYCIGMASDTPKPVQKTKLYDHVVIEQENYIETVNLKLEDWGSGCFGLSDFLDVKLPSGDKVSILVEVSAHTTPTAVSVSVIDGSNDISANGYVGMVLNYESESIGSISVSVGPDL